MTYKEYVMEDVLESIIDYRGKTPQKSEKGIPTLSAKSVKNNYIDYSECYYISPDEYKKFMVRGFPKKGDILLTTEAPLGMVAKLDRDDVAIAQRLITIRGKEGILDNDYLLYLLQSSYGQGLLRARETGTTVTGIKQAEFRKIIVKLPNIEAQKKVSSILCSIDAKIKNCQEINRILLEQGQILYKAWFIDFSHFNNIMPLNCKLGKVEDVIELHDAKRVPLSSNEREKMDKTYPYYGATSLMDYVDNYIFDGIYLLLGEDGTVMDEKGYPILQYVDGKFWVNNHAHILTGKNGFSVEELYLLFSLTNIKNIVTGAVQQKISQSNLKKVEILIPSPELLKEFDNIIQPLFAEIRNNRKEIMKLSSIRNLLLPKLIAGEMDLSKIKLLGMG